MEQLIWGIILIAIAIVITLAFFKGAHRSRGTESGKYRRGGASSTGGFFSSGDSFGGGSSDCGGGGCDG